MFRDPCLTKTMGCAQSLIYMCTGSTGNDMQHVQEPVLSNDTPDKGHITMVTLPPPQNPSTPFYCDNVVFGDNCQDVHNLTEAVPGQQGEQSSMATCTGLKSFYKTYTIQDKKLDLPAFVVDQLLSDQRVAECCACVPADIPHDCTIRVWSRDPLFASSDEMTTPAPGKEATEKEAIEKVPSQQNRCPFKKKAVQVALLGAGIVAGVLTGRVSRLHNKRR